jgi:dipeptidyl aminopeptidase/acylaminoacyl peptidase
MIALLAALAVGIHLQAGDTLSFDRLASLVVPTDAAISPDGQRVAYTLAIPDGEAWRVELWMVAADGTGARKLADGGAPSWSPSGRLLAYARRDSTGRQIWLLEPNRGTPRRLTEAPGGVVEWDWAPQSDRLAYAAQLPESEPTAAGPRRYDTGGGPALGLFVVPATGGPASRLATPGSVYASPFGGGGSFQWSPDGASIAFALVPSAAVEAAYDADLYVVDVGSGAVRPLVERPGLDVRPAWTPDGARVAFTTSFGARDRFATHGLAVVGVADGVVRDAGRAVDAAFLDAPQRHVWAVGGAALLTEAARGMSRVLLRVDASTGAATAETDRARFRSGFGFSADRRYTAYLSSTPREPYDVWWLDRATGLERRLTDLNPAARTWRLPHWETLSWRNEHGDSLEGLLARPAGADTALPTVVWLHGGPEGHVVAAFDPTVPLVLPAFDPHPVQLLAATGYAVFLPNFRGSAGYGAAFREAVTGRPGESLREDVLPGVDALIARGVADPGRLAVSGWASGGTRVGELIALTDRFRAATAGAANFDMRSAYGEGDFTVQWHSLMGGAPWEVPEAWDAASPVRNAHRVTAATLILHGEADRLVPLQQAVGYHNFLRLNGVPTELWLYPGEGHGIAGRSHRAHAARIIVGWLERWLD